MNLFSCVAFGLSLKLPSETILLNSSAHEFIGAGSSLPTTGSKIESKLKLGCSISCEKLFWVRKSSSSLSVMSIMTKHNQMNELFESRSFRPGVPKKTRKQDQKKRPIIEHIRSTEKQRKYNAWSLVESAESKYKEVYRFPLTNSQDNFSQSCEKSRIRLLLSSLTRSDEGASVLISRYLFFYGPRDEYGLIDRFHSRGQ